MEHWHYITQMAVSNFQAQMILLYARKQIASHFPHSIFRLDHIERAVHCGNLLSDWDLRTPVSCTNISFVCHQIFYMLHPFRSF